MTWQAVEFAWTPADAEAANTRWRLQLESLELAGWRGDLTVDCRRGGFRAARPRCAEGEFAWQPANESGAFAGRLFDVVDSPAQGFELAEAGISGRIAWPGEAAGAGVAVTLRFSEFDLSALPSKWVDALGLSLLEGRLDGRIDWNDGRLSFELALEGGSFDRPDGIIAGAGLSIGLEGEVLDLVTPNASPGFSLAVRQTGGELLAGPVYLPPPDAPLVLDLAGEYRPERRLEVHSLQLDDGGLVRADGGLTVVGGEGGWSLERIDIENARVELPGAWRRWGEGPAAAIGFGELSTQGTIAAAGQWRSDGLRELDVELSGVGVRDGRGRLAIEGVEGSLFRSQARLAADLEWDALALYSLQFGSSRLAAAGRPADWSLSQPLVMPLLDGAVAVDQLQVRRRANAGPAVELDVRIEPLALDELTRMIGLPPFGGRLSGHFPGVQLSGNRVAFTGGIDIRAFSGRIGLGDLVIERPFGSLPALAAQVEFDRLDLAELTGAFNFGHMEGEMSGWMRDLRLLDWRPVAMDARLFTHEDAPGRRISQRAVENLSRLGGGAAALGATVLRMFEEFPYRQAGLACRLDRNICHIDGVAPHQSGGFYIVEGRGLPHLDVVGHRRLVDWPRLVAQLVAMTEG